MDINIKDFLHSFATSLAIADINQKKILDATFSNSSNIKDCDYLTFAKRFVELENIDITSIDLEQYITWIIKNQEDSSLVIECKTLDSKECKYKFRIIKTSENIRLFSISKMNIDTEVTLIVDPLTNLYLKNGMDSVISNELFSDNPRPFSLIVVDIDNFKLINDMYGHLFGDYVLKELSKIFKKHFSNAYIGRIGGDEFEIIDFANHDYNTIWNQMHNLYSEVREYDFTFNLDKELLDKSINDFDFKNFKLTITSGVVRQPIDGKTYEDLFLKADKALYRGKKKGKDCFIIYKQDLHQNIIVEKNDLEFGNRNSILFETLISNFISELEVGTNFEETISRALKVVANYFNLDRISVYRKGKIFGEELISYYYNELVDEAKVVETDKVLNESEVTELDFNKIIKRTDVEHLKKWPKVYDFYNSLNIKSFIHIPLIYKNVTYGYIRFDMVSCNKNFTEEEMIFYKVVAKILSLYLYTYYINGDKMLFSMDSLTGLDDFNTALSKLNKILTSTDKQTVIFYTDFYKFRFFNDNFGYEAGDLVLKLLSKVLFSKDFDIKARVNGDHFLIAYEYKNDEDIVNRINDLINSLNQELSVVEGASALNFLVGVYVTSGFEDNAKSCIDKARQAVINLEQTNLRNVSYKIYDQTLNDEYKRNKNIISNFETSLQNGDFKIYLQPKFDGLTNELVGAEALTRWILNGKMMPPDSYIPLLEEYNLIEYLDLYVFDNVMKLLTDLQKDNIKIVPVSINVSKKVSNILNYVDQIEELRKKYNIDRKYIEIEFTETIINYDEDNVAKAIYKLKDLGYKIDMDDFGKGSSNLELLSRGLFDCIKLDKSLVQNKTLNNRILLYVISLIKSLGLDIVCEGVETKEDRERILLCGANIIQGYYYSKPIPMNEFVDKFLK